MLNQPRTCLCVFADSTFPISRYWFILLYYGMSWEESSLGCFKRRLDTLELFFKTVADVGTILNKEHWAVRVCA